MLMSIREYAESRKLSKRFLYKLITKGKIPAGKNGRYWLVIPEKVDVAIEVLFGSTAVKVEAPKIKKGSYKNALAAIAG